MIPQGMLRVFNEALVANALAQDRAGGGQVTQPHREVASHAVLAAGLISLISAASIASKAAAAAGSIASKAAASAASAASAAAGATAAPKLIPAAAVEGGRRAAWRVGELW